VVKFLENKFFESVDPSGVCYSALVPAVAAHPELIQLKCANHHPEGNYGYNTLETE